MNTKPLFDLPEEVQKPPKPRCAYALQIVDHNGTVFYFKTHRSGWYGHQSDFVPADQRPNRYNSLGAARNARAKIARRLKPEWRDQLKVVDYPSA